MPPLATPRLFHSRRRHKGMEEKPVKERSGGTKVLVEVSTSRLDLPAQVADQDVERLCHMTRSQEEEQNLVKNWLIHQFLSRQGNQKQKQKFEKGSVPPPIFWKCGNSKTQAQQPMPTPSSTSSSSLQHESLERVLASKRVHPKQRVAAIVPDTSVVAFELPIAAISRVENTTSHS